MRRLTYGIRRRLLLSFSAAGIGLIVGLGVFCSRVIGASMVRESEYYISKVAVQLVNHLDLYVDEMKSTLMAVALSNNLPAFLEDTPPSAHARYEAFSRMNSIMLSALSNRQYNDILLIIKDKRYILSTDKPGTTGNLDVAAFEKSAFYASMPEAPASIRVVDPSSIPFRSGRILGFALALDARGLAAALLRIAAARDDWSRGIASSYGWFPEGLFHLVYRDTSLHSEICCTTDMIDCAILLGRSGRAEC